MNFDQLFQNWDDLHAFRAGETIFSEGDPAIGVFFILEGEVESRRLGEVMSVERPGGIIGESALLGAGNRYGTAVARTHVRLARLDREQLRQLVDGNADFALQVMAALAKRLRAVDAYIGTRIAPGAGGD